jgi:hypothetical protein
MIKGQTGTLPLSPVCTMNMGSRSPTIQYGCIDRIPKLASE